MVYRKVYRKRYVPRRRFGYRRVRKYGYRNRSRIYRAPKIANQICRFKRTCEVGNYVSGTGVSFYGLSFSLDQISNYTEFQNLFDQYKIRCIVLRIWSGMTSNDANGTAAPLVGYFHYVHDYNDSVALSSLSQLYEYGNYKVLPLHSLHGKKIIVYPKLSMEFYRSATTTGYGLSNPKWLDTTNTGVAVPHFGMKYAFEWPNGPAHNYRITATYYFWCKNTK